MLQRVATVSILFQWFTSTLGNSVRHDCDKGWDEEWLLLVSQDPVRHGRPAELPFSSEGHFHRKRLLRFVACA
jgi:hypothetical protein